MLESAEGQGYASTITLAMMGPLEAVRGPQHSSQPPPLYQMIGPIQKTSTALPEATSRSFPFLLVEWAMGLSMPWNPTQM